MDARYSCCGMRVDLGGVIRITPHDIRRDGHFLTGYRSQRVLKCLQLRKYSSEGGAHSTSNSQQEPDWLPDE